MNNEINKHSQKNVIKNYITKNAKELILYKNVNEIKESITKALEGYIEKIDVYKTSPVSVDIFIKPVKLPELIKLQFSF